MLGRSKKFNINYFQKQFDSFFYQNAFKGICMIRTF